MKFLPMIFSLLLFVVTVLNYLNFRDTLKLNKDLIASYERVLESKNSTISSLQNAISLKDGTIASMERTIGLKDETIKLLQTR